MSEELARLQAERDFLLARSDHASSVSFSDKERWTGRSSNALVRHCFAGEPIDPRNYPRDHDDFMACSRTVDRLPDHLQDAGRFVLVEYGCYLARRDGDRDDNPHPPAKRRRR